MLSNAPVSAILPATDMERAKDFYLNKLGLSIAMGMDTDPMIFSAGNGTTIVVYKRAEATKAEHTVAGFLVSDVVAEVKELRAKGVEFEEYDMPGLKTVDGIADAHGVKSAWFIDTEGNILALNQM